MRFLLNFAVFLLVAPVAPATSYAFTISNCFAQSAIVAEVELTDARIYPSDIASLKEVELSCKVLTIFKGPLNLTSFRARFHSERKPPKGKALVLAFRRGNKLRVFNGGNCLVLDSEKRYGEIKSEIGELEAEKSAKPMKGFKEGDVGDVTTLDAGVVQFSK